MSDNKESKFWMLQNVENEAKLLAKQSAKKNKIKIGEWVTKLILNKKSSTSLESLVDDPLNSIDKVSNKIITRLDQITTEIHGLHNQISSLSHAVHTLSKPKKTIFDKFFN